MLGGAILGGIIGGMIGASSYVLYAVLTDCFEWRDFWVVTATGAITGAMIFSGFWILPLMGAGGAVSGAGYLVSNVITRSSFNLTDFGIAVGVGAMAGALTPWASAATKTIAGQATLGAIANSLQFGLTEYAHGRDPFTEKC